MATREQLMEALRRADAAGDEAAARAIARRIQATPAQTVPQGGAVDAQGGVNAGGPVPPTVGDASTQPAASSASPELGTMEKVRRGVAASGIKMGLALGELNEMAPVPMLAKALGWKGMMPEEAEKKRILEMVKEDVEEGGGVSKAAEIGGDIAATVIPGARAYSAVRAGTAGLKPVLSRALASIGSGAGMGAALAPEDRGTAALAGGIGGPSCQAE